MKKNILLRPLVYMPLSRLERYYVAHYHFCRIILTIVLGCHISILKSQTNNIELLSNQTEIIETGQEFQTDSIITKCLSYISTDSIRKTMEHLQDFNTRFLLAPNRKEVASWIRDQFIYMGYPNSVLDSFQTNVDWTINNHHYDTTTWQYNVITTIDGQTNPDLVYVIGGHYDAVTYDDPMSLAPGADDDASGIAATLEIARAFKETGFTPSATIKFVAFGAEEAMLYHCDIYGSQHYVNNAIINEENIIFFITNDMIANATNNTDWKLRIRNHNPEGWVTKMAVNSCNQYTSLIPLNIDQGNSGADDYPFWKAGIPTLFMFEDEFSPNYHTNADLVVNCNVDYCAEVTKVSAAMLINSSEIPLIVEDLFIENPGDGHTLIPSWKPNAENNIAYYKVYLGMKAGDYDTSYLTTDTSIIISELFEDSIYYFGVCAVNTYGFESLLNEKADVPADVTFDKGILIVQDSKGGFENPTEEQIDDFYRETCSKFEYANFNATEADHIFLSTLGDYSTLLWHINDFSWSESRIYENIDILKNYINLGGHILFTIYNPSLAIEKNTLNTNCFAKGSFIYDYCNVECVDNHYGPLFKGAKPTYAGMDSIYIDSIKIPFLNHHIFLVEALTPTNKGEYIFLYDTDYDTLSTQGFFYGKPVGIIDKGTNKKVVITSFPLYYMNKKQSEKIVEMIMHDYFSEPYLQDIDESGLQELRYFVLAPNPAKNLLEISFTLKKNQSVHIAITDISGKVYNLTKLQGQNQGIQKFPVDIKDLAPGLYLCTITTDKYSTSKKFVKSNW